MTKSHRIDRTENRLQNLALSQILPSCWPGVDKVVESGFFPTWCCFISFVQEEGRSYQLRVPGKAAGRVLEESGKDWMHGQSGMGDPDEIGHYSF